MNSNRGAAVTRISIMKNIITDEEENRFWEVYCKSHGSGRDYRKAALLDFLNNRPQVAPEIKEITICHLPYQDRPFVHGHIELPDGSKKDVWLKSDGSWTTEDGHPDCGITLGSWNRPQVAQLRPIAEMPEKVPEGCVRFYGDKQFLSYAQGGEDTLAVDIQLPTSDPDAEERRQFEAWVRMRGYTNQELQRQTEPGATYKDKDAEALWLGWKARSELTTVTTA